MEITTKGFKKPEGTEFYDIDTVNYNTQLSNDLIEENSSAIGQIANERGYKNIPIIATDILLKTTNGWCRGHNVPNAPEPSKWFFYRTVIMGDSEIAWGYGFIEAYEYETKKKYIRYCENGTWKPWEVFMTGSMVYNPNLLDNGDFQIWQKGTSFQTIGAGPIYTADRWYIHSQSDGIKAEKTTKGIKLTKMNNTIGPYAILGQPIENLKSLKLVGKNVAVSVDLFLGSSLKGNLSVGYGIPTGNGQYGIKKKLSVVGRNSHSAFVNDLGTNQCVMMQVDINDLSVGEFIEISDAKLELGEIATPFSPKPPAEELTNCKRYYEEFTESGIPINSRVLNNEFYELFWYVEKRVPPTITISSNSSGSANEINRSTFVGNMLSNPEIAGVAFRKTSRTVQMYKAGAGFQRGDIISCQARIDANIY